MIESQFCWKENDLWPYSSVTSKFFLLIWLTVLTCIYMCLSNRDSSSKSENGNISYRYTISFGLWKTLEKIFLSSLTPFKANLVHYISVTKMFSYMFLFFLVINVCSSKRLRKMCKLWNAGYYTDKTPMMDYSKMRSPTYEISSIIPWKYPLRKLNLLPIEITMLFFRKKTKNSHQWEFGVLKSHKIFLWWSQVLWRHNPGYSRTLNGVGIPSHSSAT